MRKKRLVIVSGPGAGKGTLLRGLVEVVGARLDILSMSKTINAMREDRLVGPAICEAVDNGFLVPMEIAWPLFENEYRRMDPSVLLACDGVVRTREQVKAFLELMSRAPRQMDIIVVFLDVPLDVCRLRMKKRGRDDDTPEIIDRRIRICSMETVPAVLDCFAGFGIKVITINGNQSPKKVVKEAQRLLQGLL